MTPEFNLIQRFFTRPTPQTDLGVGDDAALISIKAGHQLAVSADMSVVGTHFFEDCAPYFIGWKSLAVNISDMAAMGAQPKWATLAIALPEINEAWLSEFSRGFFACAKAFEIDLIGGDTTRGPLNISVQIMGEVPINQALRRDAAQVDDDIWVSGHLGDAAVALATMQNRLKLKSDELAVLRTSLEQPQPRVALGLALRGIATSAIDISDGLLADLGHILARSNLGAEVYFSRIPCSEIVSAYLPSSLIQTLILAGGDDYELCFTAPKSAHANITHLAQQLNIKLSAIGRITGTKSLLVYDAEHRLIPTKNSGYDHFA